LFNLLLFKNKNLNIDPKIYIDIYKNYKFNAKIKEKSVIYRYPIKLS